MKKHYKTIRLMVVLLSLLSMKAAAQLSGIVTINSGAPTLGTNYQTFTAFANTLNAVGVSGPLTVNVVTGSGPYNEQVNFIQTPGISATNTITINGNGCTITIAGAAAATAWTILLSGADYMTFNNLNIVGTGATNALACHLWNGANNNQFFNCSFITPQNVTGSVQAPFSISGTSISATSTGNSGNNNIVNTCTMTGGYYSTVFTGVTAAPFNNGNQAINCLMREFYYYGFYNAYCQYSVLRGCVLERPTRAAISGCYAIYLTTSTTNALVERNHVRRLADGVVGSTTALYAIYVAADASANNENVIINNLVSNLTSNGTQAGVYITGGSYARVLHNTIVLNDVTSTAGTTYGIYCTGPSNHIRNNIVSITRGGTGGKNCLYYTTAVAPLISNHNVLHMNSNSGTNGVGYLGANYVTLANWQATNYDLLSSDADPVFTNPGAGNYVPTSMLVNNLCAPLGVTSDFNLAARSPVFPDPGAFEFYNTPCSTTPGPNSFVTPNIPLCPGSIQTLNLLNSGTYTNSGYAIQWQMSTQNILGPYLAVSGATLNSYTTPPINQTTYYSAQITCANGGGTLNVPGQMIQVALTTTNTVPYYESFETLSLNDLPNCSWNSTSPGGSTITYTNVYSNYRAPHTGTNYAAFSGGSNYFYSNGVYMQPGITYSAAIWFIHEIAGFNNWADLSILVGPAQSPAGMQLVASNNGTLTPNLYTLLSNTFTVANPGLYYVGIRGTSGAGAASYLSWDDLSITIPCQYNTPFMQLNASASTICNGQSVNISAIGANTYAWSNGAAGPFVTVAPNTSTTYVATGTSPLSGCTASIAQAITVLQSPQVTVFANDPVICPGDSVTLSAQGAASYFWSNNANAASVIVAPAATGNYSVIGTNAQGCSSMAVLLITVNPPASPVQASISNTLLCAGDVAMLSASGSQTYQWMTSSNSILTGNPINVIAGSSSAYTVTGTDANGCSSNTVLNFRVDQCTGLNEQIASSAVKVYPNPSSGSFVIETGRTEAVSAEVLDVTGRVILLTAGTVSGNMTLDLSAFANGIYSLKLRSESAYEVIRIVKQ